MWETLDAANRLPWGGTMCVCVGVEKRIKKNWETLDAANRLPWGGTMCV